MSELTVTNSYISGHGQEVCDGLKSYIDDMVECDLCILNIAYNKTITVTHSVCAHHSIKHNVALHYTFTGSAFVQDFLDDYMWWIYRQGTR